MTVTATELHRNTTEVLKKAREYGSVIVTVRGKPVAKLVSLQSHDLRSVTQHPAFGTWKGRKDMKDPAAWVRNIRKPRYRVKLAK
jgi:prevent-host-death family protein